MTLRSGADTAEVVEGQNGLPKVQVTTAEAAGEMYLHGAQVTSWTPAGAEDVLFLSERSRWEAGRAIRGGIPICFPWFGNRAGDSAAPAHGFVRTKGWRLESITQGDRGITVSMFTESDAETKRSWAAGFRLVHRVTFGPALTLELVVTNTGTGPMRFEEALHSYFRVARIGDVRVRGLDGASYLDKPDAYRQKIQRGDITFVSETDRVFLDATDAIEIIDEHLRRRIRMAKEQSRATVVWNPWSERAHALSDLSGDEWTRFVCVEAGNVNACAVDLEPGHQHTMKAVVTVAPL